MVKERIYTRKYLSPVARDGERGDLCPDAKNHIERKQVFEDDGFVLNGR